jgi:hypothetical protein
VGTIAWGLLGPETLASQCRTRTLRFPSGRLPAATEKVKNPLPKSGIAKCQALNRWTIKEKCRQSLGVAS